ncbi:Phosphopantetheine adenylyltransferase [Madurella mycetomatis]|uniref:Phosphopantetheine adenylyltransferase n=1 Tax=Madurella mycetomatis TaxID=100816 RepID=A0A175W816_9PEZI|nr:Phosphopantetheine adenylyltransferase [Madurella mycetomatis]
MKRDDLPSLLLLPFPPNPSSRSLLNAAYRPSITAALSKLKHSTSASKLIIAVACPVLHGPFLRSKTLSWPEAQALIAGVYSVLSVVCAKLSIGTEVGGGAGSVDATVVLIDHDRNRRFTPDFRPAIEPNNTVVVDMATFASAYHPWSYVFHARSEPGLQLYQTYLRLAEGRQTLLQEQLVPVEGGLTMNVAPRDALTPAPQTSTYPVVCLGGTFDYLHPGHKLLLTAGALLLQVPRKDETAKPCQYVIGITGDEMLRNKKFAEYVQPWEERARNVIVFLSRLLELSGRGWKDGTPPGIDEQDGDFRATFRDGMIQVQCVRIHDPFGPTITVEGIDALIVSAETRSGGQAVNEKRVEQGWRALEVFEVDVLDAEEISDEPSKTENFASKISSTAIRQLRAQTRTQTKI